MEKFEIEKGNGIFITDMHYKFIKIVKIIEISKDRIIVINSKNEKTKFIRFSKIEKGVLGMEFETNKVFPSILIHINHEKTIEEHLKKCLDEIIENEINILNTYLYDEVLNNYDILKSINKFIESRCL